MYGRDCKLPSVVGTGSKLILVWSRNTGYNLSTFVSELDDAGDQSDFICRILYGAIL
jgi:hypothetical protein